MNALFSFTKKWGVRLVALVLLASISGTLLATTRSSAAGDGGPITGISGRCLANKDGTVANGNKIQLENCNGSDQQKWQWTGDKTVRVQGYCLDTQNSGSSAGTLVQLASCNGSASSQKWRPMADGSLVHTMANLCLGTVGASSALETGVQLSACNAAAADQRWNITQAVIMLPTTQPAPHAPLPGGPRYSATPTITLDYSMAPEFKDWMEQVVKPLVEDWYPVLADYYTYPHHHTQVINNFTIRVDPANTGVAGVDSEKRLMTIGPEYMRTHLNDGGVFIHESMHFLQFNSQRNSSGLPGWIIEGWADHAREVVYRDRPLRQPTRDESYLSGYSPASFLLDSIEQSTPGDFIKELAKRGWDNTYTVATMRELTGKNIAENWLQATNQSNSNIGGIRNAISNRCLDLPASNSADGSQTQLYDCNNTTAQNWIFKAMAATPNQGIVIGELASRCLAVLNNATADGSAVAYKNCGSSSNPGQLWEHVGGTLRNPNSGKCLQPVGGSSTNGIRMEIQPCSGSVTQQWILSTIYKNAPTPITSSVAYETQFSDGLRGIGLTDGMGGAYTALAKAPAGSRYNRLAWSPDASSIAFFKVVDGQQTASLQLANGNGNNIRTVATTGYFMSTDAPSPIWSADGTKLLIAVTPDGQSATENQWRWLWVNADGSGQQLLSESALNGRPFAVKDNKIYFVKKSTSDQFCTVNATDASNEACFGQPAAVFQAVLSPNGSRVASLATPNTIQVTVNGGATATVSLANLGASVSAVEQITWIPGTTTIAFRAVVNSKAAWYSVDPAAPSQIQKLNINAGALNWWSNGVPQLTYGAYTPLAPFRITDTRPNSGQLNAGKTIGGGQTLDIQVAGLGGVPAEGVSAVVLNVVEASASGSGYITVFPTGAARPNASTLNYVAGGIVNNQTTVGVGKDGKVSFFNNVGNTDLVVDVVGYYGDKGGSFHSVSPTRVIDTRSTGQTIGQAGELQVQIAGAAGVPSNATSVAANVTIVNTTAGGHLTFFPAGTTRPLASSINYAPGKTLTKEINVKLGTNGALMVGNSYAPTNVDVIIDIVGYYTSDMSGMTYAPVTPSRIVDTRGGSGYQFAGQAVGAGGVIQPRVSESIVPANALALINNMTVPTSTVNGAYLLAYPENAPSVPVGTSITFTGDTAFNQSTVRLSSGPAGGFKVYNRHGTSEVILDVLGYYY